MRLTWLGLAFAAFLLALPDCARAAVTCPAGVTHCAMISWSPPATGPAVTGFNVYRSSVNGGCATLTAVTCKKVGATATVGAVATLSFLDSPLTALSSYFWVVTATNGTGESLGSAQAAGTTLDDTPGQPGSIVIQLK